MAAVAVAIWVVINYRDRLPAPIRKLIETFFPELKRLPALPSPAMPGPVTPAETMAHDLWHTAPKELVEELNAGIERLRTEALKKLMGKP